MVSNTCTGKIKYTYTQTLNSRANKLHSFVSCTRHRNLTNNLQCQENHFTRIKNTRGTDNSLKSEMNQTTHRAYPAKTIFYHTKKIWSRKRDKHHKMLQTYLQNQILCKQVIRHFTIHHKSQCWRHLKFEHVSKLLIVKKTNKRICKK